MLEKEDMALKFIPRQVTFPNSEILKSSGLCWNIFNDLISACPGK